MPTLCVNGSMDQFFGRRNSVSETVVKRASDSMLAKGDRPHITGDAALRMAELGMTRALVAQMEGAKHAMCATHISRFASSSRIFSTTPWRARASRSGGRRTTERSA